MDAAPFGDVPRNHLILTHSPTPAFVPGLTMSYPTSKKRRRVTCQPAAPTLPALHPLYIRAGTGYNTTPAGVKARVRSGFILGEHSTRSRILPPTRRGSLLTRDQSSAHGYL